MAEEKPKIKTRIILQVVGAPKEHVEEAIKGYVQKIKDEAEQFTLITEATHEAVPEGKFWSTFAELEIEFKDVYALTGFCFDYMPASIEVFEPEHVTYSAHEFSNIINDLQDKLHKVDMVAKNINAEHKVFKMNFHKLLQNAIMLSLRNGNKSAEQIAKYLGLETSAMEKALEVFIKEGKIKKDGELYTLAQ